jgi:hypothetical protein
MALGIQSTCYIDTVNPPVVTYNVLADSWDHTPNVMMANERSVTGKLHVHRIVDGSGDPYQFEEDKVTIMATLAEMAVLRALIGKTVYYVCPYHDPDNLANYVVTTVLVINPGGVANVDPMCTYWRVTCEFLDDSTVT